MRKNAIILCTFLMFIACETKKEKEERLFVDEVFDSEYLLKRYERFIKLKAHLPFSDNAFIVGEDFVYDYNIHFGDVLGYTKNVDSIKAYVERADMLYFDYVQYETFVWFSRDSIEKAKYLSKKDEILKKIQSK